MLIQDTDPGSESWFFTHPGSIRGKKSTVSRIRNTDHKYQKFCTRTFLSWDMTLRSMPIFLTAGCLARFSSLSSLQCCQKSGFNWVKGSGFLTPERSKCSSRQEKWRTWMFCRAGGLSWSSNILCKDLRNIWTGFGVPQFFSSSFNCSK